MSRLFRDCVAFLVILTSRTAGSVRAQTLAPTTEPGLPPLPPQDIIPPTPLPPLPEKPPSQLPTPEEILPSPSEPTRPDGELPDTEETITVTEFRFTGNTAFTSEELAAKLANSKEFKEELEETPAGLRSIKPLSLSRLLEIAEETIPDSRFFAWRGQAQWLQLLGSETLLLVRGNIQLAGDALLASEQFSIGGFNSVRGYRQDARLTDNGFVVSAEVRLPVLRVPESQGVLQLIPFVDYGIGWNSAGRFDPDAQNLASVGLSLQWQQGDNFIARFDWGIPLVDIDSRDRTWQENGLLFSVQWNLF